MSVLDKITSHQSESVVVDEQIMVSILKAINNKDQAFMLQLLGTLNESHKYYPFLLDLMASLKSKT
ncbi:MAG: hypothetical protein HAW67_04925 [Endozoicomonadaceae bacterium]|nr:hypothetical protein [Endozoicomonadaceae bacterium]